MQTMRMRFFAILAALGVVSGVWATVAVAQNDADKPAEFTEAFLKDSTNITTGGEIWVEQCRHCHGKSAYPGKAPKLKPRRYKPDFVYDRVTNGFRKMPPWKEVYNREERMSIVAYILSKEFSP